MFLTSLLIVVITPSISSQGVAEQFSQIDGGSELILTQKIQKEGNTAKVTQPDLKDNDYIPVVLEGETLFSYSSEIEGFSAEARAQQTVQNITKVAQNSAITLNEIKIIEQEGLRVIATESESLVSFIRSCRIDICNCFINSVSKGLKAS